MLIIKGPCLQRITQENKFKINEQGGNDVFGIK